ncbi:hypothetical protein APHAL10511_007367 [Amanita phalloides]|nr:hypothetical protein APHAL10511_007367 [Amanita phalloides]
MAKPQPQRIVTAENGELYLAPEDSQRDPLPSYADAQADAAPSYWETVVHAPADPSGSGILVDDLPTGSILVFVLNAIISFFFQFVGFFLTYLLHTTHAAKYGSRAGLGLTLIQYGLFSRSALPEKNNSPPIDMNNSTLPEPPMAPVPDDHLTFSSKDWLSILFMSIGWFLLLSSIIGYWRVKRWEASIRSSQNQALPSTRPSAVPPAEVERERIMRQQIENVFGITIPHPFDDRNSRVRFDESGDMLIIPNRDILAEARLRRDLHAAGLL